MGGTNGSKARLLYYGSFIRALVIVAKAGVGVAA